MDKTDVITTKISEGVTLTVKMVLIFFFLTAHDLSQVIVLAVRYLTSGDFSSRVYYSYTF